ncbi:ATP-binding cassette sub-family A member 3 [Trichinella spiralis]|uniref:ATP-binding cassette sub-family A member 3 n=1 Tax=Trichinella spiralis TaxID=6334 RepID=UPI0001EFEC0C|nr:ATP-binding cassette sub-family A member 3 [Trichinella spiralis]
MVEDIMKELNQLDLCGCSAYGAVVFEEGFLNEAGLGEELKYKIRLSNTPRNSQSRRGTWNIGQASLFNVGHGWKTNALYAFPPQNGPRQSNSTDGGKPGYWREGFLILQHAIDKAIIRMLASNVTDVDKFHVHLKRFVYPPYVDNPFITVIQQHLPRCLHLQNCGHGQRVARQGIYACDGLEILGSFSGAFYLQLPQAGVHLDHVDAFPVHQHKRQENTGEIGPQRCVVLFLNLFGYVEVQVRIGFIYSFVFVCHRRCAGNVVAGCTGLVWCSLYWPYFFIQPRYASVLRSTKLLTCLLVNSAMSYGIQLIGILEGQNVGLQWYNLFHRGTMYNNLSMIEVIGMLLVDAVLCLSIAWYVEAAKPRYNSIRQFISSKFCHKLFGSRRRKNSIGQVSSESSASNSAVGHFEDCDNPARVTIYENQSSGRKTAVEDLTLDLYYGQITALLGHNGAGKSTTISILTGVLAPSCGSVTINGMDMRKHFDKIQTTLGYCPQYNPLFACMTVYEHLKFYCKLKGRQLMPTEVDRLLHLLNLESKRHSLADHLSGGMKRKLCVAIALIGGSEVVLLDEPTTGMDPRARHDAWQLLLEEKQYRTMLLTTHFMEEADLLGDRIAVLSNGTLQCCGTSFFLKRQFVAIVLQTGDGYRLKVIFKYAGKEKAEQLLKLIEEYIPGAQLSNCIGTEAIYTVPLIKGPKLHALFASIEQKLDQYDVESFGLSIVTMEEVFLRVSPKEPAVDNGQAHLSALADELDHSKQTGNTEQKKSVEQGLQVGQAAVLGVGGEEDAGRGTQWSTVVGAVGRAGAVRRGGVGDQSLLARRTPLPRTASDSGDVRSDAHRRLQRRTARRAPGRPVSASIRARTDRTVRPGSVRPALRGRGVVRSRLQRHRPLDGPFQQPAPARGGRALPVADDGQRAVAGHRVRPAGQLVRSGRDGVQFGVQLGIRLLPVDRHVRAVLDYRTSVRRQALAAAVPRRTGALLGRQLRLRFCCLLVYCFFCAAGVRRFRRRRADRRLALLAHAALVRLVRLGDDTVHVRGVVFLRLCYRWIRQNDRL